MGAAAPTDTGKEARTPGAPEIGRAACRGRGEISGGAGSLKKKKKEKERGTVNKDGMIQKAQDTKKYVWIVVDLEVLVPVRDQRVIMLSQQRCRRRRVCMMAM